MFVAPPPAARLLPLPSIHCPFTPASPATHNPHCGPPLRPPIPCCQPMKPFLILPSCFSNRGPSPSFLPPPQPCVRSPSSLLPPPHTPLLSPPSTPTPPCTTFRRTFCHPFPYSCSSSLASPPILPHPAPFAPPPLTTTTILCPLTPAHPLLAPQFPASQFPAPTQTALLSQLLPPPPPPPVSHPTHVNPSRKRPASPPPRSRLPQYPPPLCFPPLPRAAEWPFHTFLP